MLWVQKHLTPKPIRLVETAFILVYLLLIMRTAGWVQLKWYGTAFSNTPYAILGLLAVPIALFAAYTSIGTVRYLIQHYPGR